MRTNYISYHLNCSAARAKGNLVLETGNSITIHYTVLVVLQQKQLALLLVETEAVKQEKEYQIQSHFKAIQEAYVVLIHD